MLAYLAQFTNAKIILTHGTKSTTCSAGAR
jgi:hypothetical protein